MRDDGSVADGGSADDGGNAIVASSLNNDGNAIVAGSLTDDGNAIVEFVWLAVLLMVPLVYVLLTVFAVQRTSYGLAAATREAGRAFVTSPTSADAEVRAQAAAGLVLRDNGVATGSDDLDIHCSAEPCLTPGAVVRIRIERAVPLPLVPSFLRGHLPDAVSVSGEHVEVVDRYRPVRP